MELTDKLLNRQVLGCVMKNPLLLVDNEIIPEDFGTNRITKVLFINVRNLFEKGATKTIEPLEVEQEIERYDISSVVYKQERGLEVLKESFEIAKEENFPFYYSKMKKLSVLRILKQKGYDISPYYKEDYESVKEENETIERFDKATVEDILDYVEGNFNRIKSKVLQGKKGETKAAKGINELIDGFLNQPEIGVEICGTMFNNAMMGARLGTYYLRSASSGTGKALPNYLKVPMMDGSWKKVREVQVGDRLIGLNGKATRVLAIHPQEEKKQVYEVVFKDGRKVECCKDHLWSYYKLSHGVEKLFTSSTEELFNLKNTIGLKNSSKKSFRYKIPLPSPIEYEEKELYPSPYVMGLILGDGSFRYDKSQKAFSFSSENEELPQYIADFLGCSLKRNREKNYNWYFQFLEEKENRKNVWVEEILKNYPELWNKKSEDKFIPKDYLVGSKEQRVELLKGLLDTDGYISKEKGRVSFTNISKQLIDDVVNLCHSLGMITSVSEDKRTWKYTTGVCYTVHIQCSKKMKPLLFNLTRKKERAEEYAKTKKREERKDWLPIVDIVKTDRYEEMTCFTVDAEDSLFLIDSFIPTHNTRMAVFDACKICFPTSWSHEKKSFMKEVDENGRARPARKTLIITTELTKEEVQTMILAYLSGVNESHIIAGRYLEEEIERVRFAAKIMERYEDYLFIDEISDPNLMNVSASIKKYATLEKVQYVFNHRTV